MTNKAQATVRKQRTKYGKDVGPERIKTEEVDAPGDVKNKRPAALTRVIYHHGVTVGLPNYSGEKIYVGLEPVCKTNPDSMDLMFDFAREWVDKRLDHEVGKIDVDE